MPNRSSWNCNFWIQGMKLYNQIEWPSLAFKYSLEDRNIQRFFPCVTNFSPKNSNTVHCAFYMNRMHPMLNIQIRRLGLVFGEDNIKGNFQGCPRPPLLRPFNWPNRLQVSPLVQISPKSLPIGLCCFKTSSTIEALKNILSSSKLLKYNLLAKILLKNCNSLTWNCCKIFQRF